MVDETVEREGMEESLVPCTTAEGEQRQDSRDLIDFYSEVFPSLSELFACPVMAKDAVYELPVCPEMTMMVGLICLPWITVCLSCRYQGGCSSVRCTPCPGNRGLVCVDSIHHS